MSQELTTMPSDHEMMVFNTMAKQAVESKMYRGIGDVAGIMMVMLSAREMGICPMMALNGGLNLINGKVEISARMMNSLIRRAGHSISITESTESLCTLAGKRRDTQDTATASYSILEAQKAGLVKPGGGWTKYPKDMLFARAMSRLSRQLFSDVIGIGYVEGEIKEKDTPPEPHCISMELSVEPAPEIVEDTEPQLLQKFLDIFDDKGEKYLALKYLEAVMKHFAWSKVQAIQELLKDEKKLIEKFNAWNNKIKKAEECQS